MKRYLVFAGSTYYPNGGWDDLIGSFDTLDECQAELLEWTGISWFQVVDTQTWMMTHEPKSRPGWSMIHRRN